MSAEMDKMENAAKRIRTKNEAPWGRPLFQKTVDPEVDSLSFMLMDIDYYTDNTNRRYSPDNSNPKAGTLRMYGTMDGGQSIVAHVHGFLPYFYVEVLHTNVNPEIFRESLDNELKRIDGSNMKRVVSVETVQLTSIQNYQQGGPSPFFKVTVAYQKFVKVCREILERGMALTRGDARTFSGRTTYETNVPFPLRYMIDQKLVGGGWVEIAARNYSIRAPSDCQTTCQLEIDVNYRHLNPEELMKIAPIRILSFDIECYNPEEKGFPTAEKCPVIQVAFVLKVQGEKEERNAIFVLGSCSTISDCNVYTFDDEATMLMQIRNFICETDPDMLTGYNIQNFDIPYLLERAQALGIGQDFSTISRVKQNKCTIRDAVGAHGQSQKEVAIDGRIIFDMHVVIKREHQLRSYTLNYVSSKFLDSQKDDVHYSIIGTLHNGDSDTRRRLALYCLKDSQLPLLLMDKLLCVFNYIEMARVTGTPINFLLTRGQMIKVASQLLRKAKSSGYVVPTRHVQASDEKFEGATVLDPITGYYDVPIATLDFASLYPSIMMAHNLCYCTLIDPKDVSKFTPEQMTKTPVGNHFVKSTVQRGILPQILEELLAARKRAKKEMAEATDPLTKGVLNGRQLALKISANSVYGFTGATIGMMPCLEISSSVTAFGREMIDTTKKHVEEKYTVENGYAHNAKVIYGDTDSVMVKFGTDSVEESMRLGKEAAEQISTVFLRPVKLEFEKVYFPYILMAKKRYAGLFWTSPEKHDKLDTKGIETVRRDNCAVVVEVVETILKKILIDRSVEKAVDYAKSVISDLLQNKVDLSMLVITKSLGKGANREDYAVKAAHVELAERMRKRDPASAPGAGDRVPYVIIKGQKKQPTYEKSEDPIFVLEQGLAIDAQHYIDHQLEQPLLRLFDPIMPNAKQILFSGEHTRKIVEASAPVKNAFAKFVKIGVKCLGCKVPIKAAKGTADAFCKSCRDKGVGPKIALERAVELKTKEKEFGCLWAQCQRCQNTLLQEIQCSNNDCKIFYRRQKVSKEVEKLRQDMERIQIHEW